MVLRPYSFTVSGIFFLDGYIPTITVYSWVKPHKKLFRRMLELGLTTSGYYRRVKWRYALTEEPDTCWACDVEINSCRYCPAAEQDFAEMEIERLVDRINTRLLP